MLDKAPPKPRFMLASVLAPFAVLVFPYALFANMVWFNVPPDVDVSSRIGASVSFVLLPIIYAVLSMGMHATGEALRERKKLTLRNLLLVSVVVSVGFGLLFGYSSETELSVSLKYIALFSLFAMANLSAGMVAWWYLANYKVVKTQGDDRP